MLENDEGKFWKKKSLNPRYILIIQYRKLKFSMM